MPFLINTLIPPKQGFATVPNETVIDVNVFQNPAAKKALIWGSCS